MTKKAEATRTPTFTFEFYRTEDPREWTARYLRDGKVAFEITAPNSYIFCEAVMERRMRSAPYDADPVKE